MVEAEKILISIIEMWWNCNTIKWNAMTDAEGCLWYSKWKDKLKNKHKHSCVFVYMSVQKNTQKTLRANKKIGIWLAEDKYY